MKSGRESQRCDPDLTRTRALAVWRRPGGHQVLFVPWSLGTRGLGGTEEGERITITIIISIIIFLYYYHHVESQRKSIILI